MTLTVFGEIVKSVSPLITALAAVFGAWLAYQGLHKWRTETLGKRKAEIAQDTLALVYEMEEILQSARNPFVLAHEMGKKEGVPDHIASNSNFAPEARLLAHQEFFARFRSNSFAFAALFGREGKKHLDDLWRIRLEINWAVESLLINDRSGWADKEDRDFIAEKRAVAFRPADKEKDKIGARLTVSVASIEALCRPAIEARNRPV